MAQKQNGLGKSKKVGRRNHSQVEGPSDKDVEVKNITLEDPRSVFIGMTNTECMKSFI